MKVLAVAGVSLRRFSRYRTNLFFLFVFPILLVLLLGVTFGGGFATRIGVVSSGSGPLGEDLVRMLGGTTGIKVLPYQGEAALSAAVQRGVVQGGLIVPPGYDQTLRSGGDVSVQWIARADQAGQQLVATVRSALGRQATLLIAARFASQQGISFDRALQAAARLAPSVPAVTVSETTAGKELIPSGVGPFDLGAQGEVVLFVFLTSLAGSVALVETRRLGVSRRMLSTPTSARQVLAGEALGRFAIAMVQGLVIVAGTALLFGVSWGDPLGAGALLVAMALAATAAAMLLGSVMRTEQQASSISILLGLGLAALGGCMVPLALFSPTMKRVAHATPQAWALDGFTRLVQDGRHLPGVLPQVAVLLAFAAVLGGLAAWRLRKTITA